MTLCKRLMVTSLWQTKAKAQNQTKPDTANKKPTFVHCEELDTAAAVRSNPWRARKNPVNVITSFLVFRSTFLSCEFAFYKPVHCSPSLSTQHLIFQSHGYVSNCEYSSEPRSSVPSIPLSALRAPQERSPRAYRPSCCNKPCAHVNTLMEGLGDIRQVRLKSHNFLERAY